MLISAAQVGNIRCPIDDNYATEVIDLAQKRTTDTWVICPNVISRISQRTDQNGSMQWIDLGELSSILVVFGYVYNLSYAFLLSGAAENLPNGEIKVD